MSVSQLFYIPEYSSLPYCRALDYIAVSCLLLDVKMMGACLSTTAAPTSQLITTVTPHVCQSLQLLPIIIDPPYLCQTILLLESTNYPPITGVTTAASPSQSITTVGAEYCHYPHHRQSLPPLSLLPIPVDRWCYRQHRWWLPLLQSTAAIPASLPITATTPLITVGLRHCRDLIMLPPSLKITAAATPPSLQITATTPPSLPLPFTTILLRLYTPKNSYFPGGVLFGNFGVLVDVHYLWNGSMNEFPIPCLHEDCNMC